jgi:hypothetical protein
MATKTMTGSNIILYLGGKIFPVVQNLTYSTDFGFTEIYGIDSPYAQEIAPTRISVTGTVTGLMVRGDCGTQGYGLTQLLKNYLSTQYITLRCQDRYTKDDIFTIKDMIISNQSATIPAKGLVSITFSFKGIMPTFPLDRN